MAVGDGLECIVRAATPWAETDNNYERNYFW